MKNVFKLLMIVGAITLTTNIFAEELGLKMSNLKMYSAPKSSKSSSSGGIQKGLVQIDLAFNLGAADPIWVGTARAYNDFLYDGFTRHLIGFRPGFTFNLDVAVHPYVSVGGYFGLDGSVRSPFDDNYKDLGIGIGARGVFHIYQLISDKANTKVDPGKLDFYFPFHVGGIIRIITTPGYVTYNGKKSFGGLSIGGGLGVRYYFTDKIGIMGEVGWLEMAVFKVGLAIKL